MKPILYSPEETVFNTNGIGVLSDAISCKVDQVLNGKYELTLQYPVDGLFFDQIRKRSLVLAKADQTANLQPFRVYRITKPSSGIVTVYARHLAYDLAGIVVTPFSAGNAETAFEGLSVNAITDCPFAFSTDEATAGALSVKTPSDIWKLLGNTEGSLLDVYGGEYEFDGWSVRRFAQRGLNRGVSIRYGKNLTSLEQDENCSNCYTGVLPYWVDRETEAVTMLTERIVEASGNFDYTKIYPLDLSGEFKEKPSENDLRSAAHLYMEENKICEPDISWKIEFVQLEQTEEYKDLALLEKVFIGDTVEVVFEQLGISAEARAVACRYDSILERHDYVTLGSVKADITDAFVEQKKELQTKPNKKEMQTAVELLTNTILGAKGGSVRMLDTDGDGLQDTLYIADDPDPARAVKVWRFNYEGWGASTNGYNGPFELGATLAGGLLANFVTAANLLTGTIQSRDGKTFYLDLDRGILKGAFTELSIKGATVDEIAQNASNSVTIGGTNLLVGTKDFSGSNWRNIEMWSSDGEYKGFVVKTYSGQWQGLCQELSASAGEVYTMSAYIKSSGNFHFYPNIGNMGTGAADVNTLSGFGETPGWARISATFTVSQDGTLTPGFETLEDSQLWICGMKLEKGNKATDWSPSPEDQNAYADTAAEQAVSNQTQKDIFNKLTDNGTLPGLFMRKGQLYINASYLKSGIIDANEVTVENLSASSITSGKLVSENGLTSFDLSTGEIRCANEIFSTETVINEGAIACYSYGKLKMEIINTINTCSILFYGDDGEISTVINDLGDGLRIGTGGISCRAFWKANLDGTFTLMGSED